MSNLVGTPATLSPLWVAMETAWPKHKGGPVPMKNCPGEGVQHKLNLPQTISSMAIYEVLDGVHKLEI